MTDVSACSLSSCRLKAEALARALNSRIWPCTWAERGSADGEGCARKEEEEEDLFFDTSPSPVEDEEALYRRENRTAATDAGRARLCELLQQHTGDDATDVYYDVTDEGDPANVSADAQENVEGSSFIHGASNNPPATTWDLSSSDEKLDSSDLSTFSENHVDDKSESFCGSSDVEEVEYSVVRKLNIRKIDKVIPHSEKQEPPLVVENGTCEDVEEEEEEEEESEGRISPLKLDDERPDTADLDSTSCNCDSSSTSETSPMNNRLQVFEEERPLISRSISLKTGKTPPGTPRRKKIVRFADALGLDLEDVHNIMAGALPNVPSSAFAHLNLPVEEDTSVASVEATTVELQCRPASWEGLHRTAGPNLLQPLFTIPCQQLDFLERVRNQGICLESVTVSDMSVHCTCRVMNWGYRKKVVARYTVNDWASSIDIDAAYVPGSTCGEMENFTFSIFLSSVHKKVDFALRYVVNGKEYWDNNRLQNYSLSLTDGNLSPVISDPLLQHQFW